MAAAAISGQEFDLGAFIELTNGLGDMDTQVDGSLRAVNVAANEALSARIDELRTEADDTVQRYTIGGLVLIALALIIALLVVRSITRPIAQLTRQADAMANEGLPGAVQSVLATPLGADVRLPELEPVSVSSRDELQDVADSLNQVQRSAVDLAVEQATLRHAIADSLASLGRRTQGVIDEQLDLISRLEAEESEPAVLENLFRLDHLISRARRNAESLVILAGAPSAGRRRRGLPDRRRGAGRAQRGRRLPAGHPRPRRPGRCLRRHRGRPVAPAGRAPRERRAALPHRFDGAGHRSGLR